MHPLQSDNRKLSDGSSNGVLDARIWNVMLKLHCDHDCRYKSYRVFSFHTDTQNFVLQFCSFPGAYSEPRSLPLNTRVDKHPITLHFQNSPLKHYGDLWGKSPKFDVGYNPTRLIKRLSMHSVVHVKLSKYYVI